MTARRTKNGKKKEIKNKKHFNYYRCLVDFAISLLVNKAYIYYLQI